MRTTLRSGVIPTDLGIQTLAAFDPTTGSVVSFHDYVREGEIVYVYRTFEAAEDERGPSRKMRVVKADDDWTLEPVE